MCVSLFYVIDTGSTGSRGPILTWGLPVYPPPLLRRWLCRSTPSLIGSPSRHRSSGKTWVTVSWQGQDRDWQAALPGQDHMDPFGFIGVAPRYIPAGAVSELAGIRLSCTSMPTRIRKKHRRGESDSGPHHLSRGGSESRTFPSKVTRGLHPAPP